MRSLSPILPAAMFAIALTTSAVAQTIHRRATLTDTTPATLAKDYKIERKGKRPPKLGLSLSGGGTRAGHFAHGVLQGINDTGLLEKVDVISSVSGGSYAAYWYFTKRLEAKREKLPPNAMFADCLPKWWVAKPNAKDLDKTLQTLMDLAKSRGSPPIPVCPNDIHWKKDDPYRWQAHLARWPDLFARKPGFVNGNKQGMPLFTILTHSLRLLSEFTGIYQNSRAPKVYQYGIERVWGLNPKPREFKKKMPTWQDDKNTQWQYTNQRGKLWRWTMHVDPIGDWKDLKQATQGKEHFPLWVINATSGQKGKLPVPSDIYEMTALSHGMQKKGYGYINESPQHMGVDSLGEATRASAAFVDAQGVPEPWLRKFMKLHPGAEWGLKVKDRFLQKSKDLRLSDGGGSENLGLYSLIKRGIPDIIVVDAGMDMVGRMEDLCWVRKALKDENKEFDMVFEKLKQFGRVCDSQFENNGNSKVLAYNTSAWLNPVIEGSVTWPNKAMPATRLWLIKLGWHQQDFRRALNAEDCGSTEHPVNCLLTVFYGHYTIVENPKDEYMYFPHLSTVGATFDSSTYLFWGYRELGRMVTANLVWDEREGRLTLDPAVQPCSQWPVEITRKVAEAKNRRPVKRPNSPSAAPGCKPQ